MKVVRTLALIFFSIGLFVQVAAHAAAAPQLDGCEMPDCANMAQGMQDNPDRSGPCKTMTLGCLVAMNCLPPLALAGIGAAPFAPIAVDTVFLAAMVHRLEGRPTHPESPPPQALPIV